MDSLITAAAQALAAGDPLGALNRVALRDDPPALALRGIAMAQLGDLARAKGLLRRAARAFGPREAVARARCVVAEAEIALVSRDLGWSARALAAARVTLEEHGDRVNAAYARHLEVRRLLLIGRLDEAERGERALGLVEAPDQEETPHLEMPRVGGVHAVAVLLERHPGCGERPRGPAQVARDQRDLRLGDDTPRASDRLSGTEGARGATQETLGPDEITELRHGDSAQRERGRIVAQRDAVERAKGIPRGEGLGRRRDQRVHRNPARLVTLIASVSGVSLSRGQQ